MVLGSRKRPVSEAVFGTGDNGRSSPTRWSGGKSIHSQWNLQAKAWDGREQGHSRRLESKGRGCGKQQGQQVTQGWTSPFRVSLSRNVSRE